MDEQVTVDISACRTNSSPQNPNLTSKIPYERAICWLACVHGVIVAGKNYLED